MAGLSRKIAVFRRGNRSEVEEQMALPGAQRRLAAILAADAAGYSRLMEADEEATILKFKACREIIDQIVMKYGGRVFGGAGDSLIVEFASAVEAVRCAID